jgi:hypothetical protein
VFTNKFADNSHHSTTSQAATLTVGSAPSVTTQPSPQTVNVGATVTFKSVASGNPAPSVQWQVNTGAGFTNIPGATSNTLSFTATAANNGNLYRAVFSNGVGAPVPSTAAKLTVFVITQQPTSRGVVTGTTATFTVAASDPAATVQWQVKTVGSSSFVDISGQTSTTLNVPKAPLSESGNQYRAVFKDKLGSTTTTLTTQAATLTVGSVPSITQEPPATKSVDDGTQVSLTATADGPPTPTVQWQVNTGAGFKNIPGATSDTLTFTAHFADNGNIYQAVFTNAIGTKTSNTTTLSVNNALVITQQPASVTVAPGGNAQFTAAVNANPSATVQWQSKAPGATTFTNISGAMSLTLTVPTADVTLANSGTQYRAVFTSTAGTVTTKAATLTVDSMPSVTLSPVDTAVFAGQTVTFTAAATGSAPLTVQWQVDTGSGFTDIPGATSKTLSFTATASKNHNHYRAVFTNLVGQDTTTDAELIVI